MENSMSHPAIFYQYFKKKIEQGVDLFERGHKYEKVSINDSFPDYIVSNYKKYKLYIL